MVPTRNARTKANAQDLELSVIAGRMGKMASGLRPCKNPVLKVARLNLESTFCLSCLFIFISSKLNFFASWNPMYPIPISVNPTATPAKFSMRSK